jgi:hypothetical protein
MLEKVFSYAFERAATEYYVRRLFVQFHRFHRFDQLGKQPQLFVVLLEGNLFHAYHIKDFQLGTTAVVVFELYHGTAVHCRPAGSW